MYRIFSTCMWTWCFLRRSARWNFSPSSPTSPLYCEHVIRNLGSETYSDLWKRTTSFWMCPNGHPCHTISRTVWSSWRRPSRYRDRRAVATPNHRVCVRSSAIRSDIVIKPGTNSKKRHRFMCVHMWEDERQEKEAEGDRRERERYAERTTNSCNSHADLSPLGACHLSTPLTTTHQTLALCMEHPAPKCWRNKSALTQTKLTLLSSSSSLLLYLFLSNQTLLLSQLQAETPLFECFTRTSPVREYFSMRFV